MRRKLGITESIFTVYFICWRLVAGAFNNECVFPDFIQSPLDEQGQPLSWQTNVMWLGLRNDPKIREMQEVFVQRSQIWSQKQSNHLMCERKLRRVRNRATSTLFGNCSEKYLLYNRTCIVQEDNGRFQVMQLGPHQETTFVCMAFVKRSDNVVQVIEGPVKEENTNLCDENFLQLLEWPWIAPWRRSVISCPVSGGFSFRTINRLTNEDFCEDEWRKSRLEIDCTKGDGLHFIAPKGSGCNPFSATSEVSRFHCWAGWHEKMYTFLVVGNEEGIPQYCLRFPREVSGTFSVIVYFSVLCPVRPDGMPPTGIQYHEMVMTRLDPLVCVDDDPYRCDSIMRRRLCKKEEKYASHCEKSCGKCGERESMFDMMCPFSKAIHGSWIFADRFHEEKVTINHTVISFSKFGSFICKERSVSSDKRYKTVTLHSNGCSMRYTCFEFERRNNNILQFRVGKSFRTDTNLDTMCKFEDQHHTRDIYRSSRLKNLILDGRLWDEYCGFSSSIPFNGTIYGEPCSGTVSDWDSDGCVTRGVLNLRSHTCLSLRRPMEFQCLAFLAEKQMEQFIITKGTEGQYNCWVLSSYLCNTWDEWPYRILYKLDSPQCRSLEDYACIIDNTPDALLYLHDDEKSKYCKDYYTHGPLPTSPINDRPSTKLPSGIGDQPRLEGYESSGAAATMFQADGGGGAGDGVIRTNDSFSIISINSQVLTVTFTFVLFSRVWTT